MITARLLEREDDLPAIQEQWDALAVETSKPYSAPGWALPWWRNARPAGAGLRVLSAHDGDRLVGLAPLWSGQPGRSRSPYEVMAAHFSPPAGWLASPGREPEVVAALTRALAEAQPRPGPLRLEDRSDGPLAADRIVQAWDAPPPWRHDTPAAPMPIVVLDGLDYEEWFASRSSKFRQNLRRKKRRIEDEGAAFQLVDTDRLEPAIDAYIELHGSRWEDRGGSDALVPGIRAMLVEAAQTLAPEGRLRLYTVEVGTEIIAASIFVAAGDEVCYWSGGFDRSWHRHSPSLQLLLHAIADAAGRGEKRINLGPGGYEYKFQVADEQGEVSITSLVPRGHGYLGARLGLLGHQARWELSKRLTPEAKARLRRAVRR